ncbi:MAG: phage holin family protein [Clostridiales bacterium]|nr:phage holin family protein [Clostridiales bacterium]MCF8021462.1 phage holin family protein [Clostridiales bacterium]
MVNILSLVVRFVVSALVLMGVSFAAPGFVVRGGFAGALIAAVVIAVIGYVAESFLSENISPRGKGLVGFLTGAVVIYLAQFIIPSLLSVTLIGALVSALIIGIIDAVIPTVVR